MESEEIRRSCSASVRTGMGGGGEREQEGGGRLQGGGRLLVMGAGKRGGGDDGTNERSVLTALGATHGAHDDSRDDEGNDNAADTVFTDGFSNSAAEPGSHGGWRWVDKKVMAREIGESNA